MFTDPTRSKIWPQLVCRNFRLFETKLTLRLILRAAVKTGCLIGAGPLNLITLTWLSLGCACHRTLSFADILGRTIKLLADLAEGPDRSAKASRPRHGRKRNDPRCDDPEQLSAAAFTQARPKVPWAFWLTLVALLADDFVQQHPTLLRWRGRYRLLCLDGTTIDLPNHKDLLDSFGSANRGKGRRQAQARLVMLQLTQVRMPLRFDLTPLAEGEQTVAARLLTDLCRNDLVLMDRNFFTYSLFWAVQNRHAFFATRSRKQVKLKTLCELAPGDRLVEWQPASAAARKAIREQSLPTSITLRVIDYHVAGFRPSQVVTNLLDHHEVPAAEFVRLAATEEGRRVQAGLYHRRWEIEVAFLELKVTQGMEGSLRSRKEGGIRYEVAGHILLYQLMRWLLVDAAMAEGMEDPLRLSYQDALREWEDVKDNLFRAGKCKIRRFWLPRLLKRMATHVVPWRPNRHYRRPHDTKGKNKGKGRIQPASKLEKQQAAATAESTPPPNPRE
jgi:hypothetical protein